MKCGERDVNASTDAQEMWPDINGMSSYARAEANANGGFMVDVSLADYAGQGP